MKKRQTIGVTFETLAEKLGWSDAEIAAVEVQHSRNIIWLSVVSDDFDEVPEGQEAPVYGTV